MIYKPAVFLTALFFAAAPAFPQTPVQSKGSLGVNDILAMVRSKRSTTAIIAKIQHSHDSFGKFSDTQLAAKGVPAVVILEMHEANLIITWADSDLHRNQDGSLTNQDVIGMLETGLSDSVVIAKIKASKCDFDTVPATLAALRVKHVPDIVLLEMVKASQTSAAVGTSPVPPAADSMNDTQYLQTFPACEDFVKLNASFVKAGVPYYNSHQSADRDAYIGWFDANRSALMAATSSCESDPNVQKDQRASSAAYMLPEISLAYFTRALLDLQNGYYVDLINKYNQLVSLYNANLSYTRSIASQLSIAQYFTNMFRQPLARSFDCHTSEDSGFGTTTSCTAY